MITISKGAKAAAVAMLILPEVTSAVGSTNAAPTNDVREETLCMTSDSLEQHNATNNNSFTVGNDGGLISENDKVSHQRRK